MISRTALAGDHYVTIEEGPYRVVFRTASDMPLDCETAKFIQGAAGFPSDVHGFDNFLCYRDEHGRWQLDWSCFAKNEPLL